MFVTEKNSISFSCPLVYYYYQREWVKYKSKVRSPAMQIVDLESQSILKILLLVIEYLDIADYAERLSTCSDMSMLEAWWQNHFFLCFWKFFPFKIHPEVGAACNTSGNFFFTT